MTVWHSWARIGTILLAAFISPMASAGVSGRTVIFDGFDGPDGPLGPPNWEVGLGGLPSPVIAGHEACGDEQSAALYANPIAARMVRVSFPFHAAASSGFEAYVLALTTGGDVYFAGCDGGFGGSGFCRPTIGNSGGTKVVGPPIPFVVNATYAVETMFNGGQIDLTISDAGGAVLSQLSLSSGERFVRFGLIVGRDADEQLTCADDFLIEDLDPASPAPAVSSSGLPASALLLVGVAWYALRRRVAA